MFFLSNKIWVRMFLGHPVVNTRWVLLWNVVHMHQQILETMPTRHAVNAGYQDKLLCSIEATTMVKVVPSEDWVNIDLFQITAASILSSFVKPAVQSKLQRSYQRIIGKWNTVAGQVLSWSLLICCWAERWSWKTPVLWHCWSLHWVWMRLCSDLKENIFKIFPYA